MAELEHLVVQEIFLTETACHRRRGAAGVGVSREDRHVHQHRPPGAARPPGARLRPARPARTGGSSRRSRRRLGLRLDLSPARATSSTEMRQAMPSLAGITWERLEREGAVTYPCDGEDQPGHDVLFGDGFPTPTGRGKLVPAGLVPPDEVPDNEFP